MPAVFAWSGNNSETVRARSNKVRKDQAQHHSNSYACGKLHTSFSGGGKEAGKYYSPNKAAIPSAAMGHYIIDVSMKASAG
jgi:hypothetical protein